MKLFNKTIDRQLFKQYELGSDLSKQEAVVKIFNPMGAGTWFILNSDPQDPDYLWAIVDLGYGAEVGSVSRSDLETYRGKFGMGFERDLSFDPVNAEVLYKGLRQGKFYDEGGEVSFIDYKDSEIMYEPHNKKYYANDVEFDSLKEAQDFIDSGEIDAGIRDAYSKGLFADGGLITEDKLKEEEWFSPDMKIMYQYKNGRLGITLFYGKNRRYSKTTVINNASELSIEELNLRVKKEIAELKQFAKEMLENNFAEGGNLSRDREFVNYSEDYEVRYSKGRNRKGYGFADGGEMDSKDTWQNLLEAFGFKKGRSKYGLDMYYKRGYYASIDNELRNVDLMFEDDVLYRGYSVQGLLSALENQFGKVSFADGGNIENFSDNQQMIMNQNVELEHHHEELEDILEDKMPVPAWVVAKMATATQSISDVTHYLDGEKELMEDENKEEYEGEDEIKDKEVVEPINVSAGTKAELSNKFTDDALGNMKGFLNGISGIDLRDDYTFDYKDEQFEIEPIINFDDNGVSNAVFTIFDGDGEEQGEITYSREGGKQKFTANSEFFSWNNTKFEDGGFMNGVYADGGFTKNDMKMLWYVTDKDDKIKNISTSIEQAEVFLSKIGYVGNINYVKVPLNDWNSEKVTVSNIKNYAEKFWKNYSQGGYFDGTIPKVSTYMSNYAKGGKVDSFIPNVGTIDTFMLKSLLIKNSNVKSILSDKEFEFLKNENTDAVGVSGKPFNTIITDGNQEIEFDLKKNVVVKHLTEARDSIKSHYSANYVKGGELNDWIKGTSMRFKTNKEATERLNLMKNHNFTNNEYRGLRVEKTSLGYVVKFEFKGKMEDGGFMENVYAKGGMVVTSIKDIPNFKERLNERRVTYRGLGTSKLYNDFYTLAGTSGTIIKVDGKEYFITDDEFNTFSRDANGNMRVRFSAPTRKNEDGGFMNDVYAKGGMSLNDGIEYEGYNLKDINGKKIEVGDTVKTTQPSGGVLSPADSEIGVVEKTKDAFGNDALQIKYRKQGTNYDRFILLNGKINEIVEKTGSFAKGGNVDNISTTEIRKDPRGNWRAETFLEDFDGYDWRLTTVKTYSGQLISSAQGGKTMDSGSKGISMFKYTMYEDPHHTLEVSKPSRLTEKVVAEQHDKALAKFKKFMETGMFKGGGKISNFDKLSAKVAKQYEGKPVKNQYQQEYGKYYSKEEAQEVGDKVAGKVKAMQTPKNMSGGQTAGKKVHKGAETLIKANELAKEIRKEGESWLDAKRRAFAQLKK